jgi:transmembrane sensor
MTVDQASAAEGPLDQAAHWFLRLQDEAADSGDWLAFEAWLAASPDHQAAYARVERLSAEIDDLAPALRDAWPRPIEPQAYDRRRRSAVAPVTRRRWLAGGAAAAAAGVAGVVLMRPWEQLQPPAPTVYEAARGEVRDVVLADGSRIRLNAGSRVSVRMDRGARRVTMSDAEAAFDVAHDAARPFLIQVGDREVRVVGTEFNLRRREGKVVLTVRRGLVEVRPARAAAAAPVRVRPGQQLTHLETTGRTSLQPVDAEEAFGWTNGRLICRDEPLSEIAADVGRRFGKDIRTADAVTAGLRFTGVLVLDDEAAVLERLSALASVDAVRVGDVVTLRRRA